MKTQRIDPLDSVSAKFGKVYDVDLFKASLVLQDIYFYIDLFQKSTINKRNPWDKMQRYIFVRHGIDMHKKSIKRWFKKVSEFKEVSTW